MDRYEAFRSAFPQHTTTPRFEIWFAVVIDSVSQKSLWVRYTTLTPAANGAQPRAVLWASLFDAHDPANHCYGAQSFPAEHVIATASGYQYPTGVLGLDRLSGTVPTSKGPLSWDLRYQHRFEASKHTPPFIENSILRHLPKTRGVACSPFAKVHGAATLAGVQHTFRDAGGVLTHIWGTTRIDELYWLFVPAFDDDSEGWSLEMMSIKVKPFLPALTFMTFARRGTIHHASSLRTILTSSARVAYPRLDFHIKAPNLSVRASGTLDEQQVTAYIYRDPDGAERYIEQSDVGAVSCEIQEAGQARQLVCKHGAAVEFHARRPWSTRDYLDPYTFE